MMIFQKRRLFRVALVSATMFGGVVAGGVARAQDAEAPGDFEITGSAGIYSQYRFRGISFSDEDVAFQGSIDVAHASGFYLGAWGSNLAGFGTFGGANVEIDVYGGYSGEAGGFGYDVGAVWYLYPGTSGTDYVEFLASLSKALGPVEGTLGVAYAPDQNAIGSDDNIYVYSDLSVAIPDTPVTLSAHLGYSDGSLAPGGNYLDWSLGAEIAFDKLTLGVAYVDTDIGSGTAFVLDPTRNIVDGAIVVSLGVGF